MPMEPNHLTLAEYQDFVVGLASDQSTVTEQSQFLVAALGLAGESGE